MEESPLTLQERPATFRPKIAQLYDDLFQQDDQDLIDTDGFWREFFLLKPDKSRLQQRLDSLGSGDLLHYQHESQQLFSRAIAFVKEGKAPTDQNALDTLAVYLSILLTKRFTNPTSDVLTVLAGLDAVDVVFVKFATVMDQTIRTGRMELRRKALDVVLITVSGAYQTSVVSYFTYRDFFPALIKFTRDVDDPDTTSRALLLLGLLANYNKFEFRNPYRVRLEDFINETVIQDFVDAFGASFTRLRDRYVSLQDDVKEAWTVGNTLTYIGLGVLAPAKPTKAIPPPPVNTTKIDFGILPDAEAAMLLCFYEITSANKIFSWSLINGQTTSKNAETPLSTFLSFASYLLHHAHRSLRATTYGMLILLDLRILIEDLAFAKALCNADSLISVRLCRQRQPFLPTTTKPRPPVAHILDILVDTINHNLRRHLDLALYISTMRLVHRILSYLALTRTRLVYHWSLLWQTLISFQRFLITYASSFAIHDPDLPRLLRPFLSTLALSVVSGESFLPDPASYDDLFYKLVEAGDILKRFKAAFQAQITSLADASTNSGDRTSTIEPLIQVSEHYQGLVQEERAKGRLGNNPSPRQISKIIRQGYETLSLPHMEGLDRWEGYREGEEKGLLKRAARVVVDDTKQMLKP